MKKLMKFMIACMMIVASVVVMPTYVYAVSMSEVSSDKLSTQVFVYDDSASYNVDSPLNCVAPVYLIYPDKKVNASEASALLDELDMVDHINEYDTKAYVINPQGDSYNNDNDLKAYESVLDFLGCNANVKVIGIGNGATFVNDVVSKNSWCVAGIMTIGGDSKNTAVPNAVPAYLCDASDEVIAAYKTANSATKQEGTSYINTDNPLEKVTVTTGLSKAEAFKDAWDKVFSNNYRMYNEKEEWYTAGLLKYKTPYELVPYTNYDKLGLDCVSHTGKITSNATDAKPNQWYEVTPKSFASAGEGTIPLVVVLHGNTNDNRMQLESSGWAQKASEKNLMLLAPEHQASGNSIGESYTALEEQGTIDLVKKTLETYPQLDASRVYLCGLSLGAMRTFSYGINNSGLFAAVEGSSGTGNSQLIEAANNEIKNGTATRTPCYMICGTYDTYKMIPVSDSPDFSGYNVIRGYGLLNDLDIPEKVDMSKNEWYGLQLDDQKDVYYHDIKGYTGTLSNDQGVMLKCVAMDPYAHWNSPQMIDSIYDFFSQYSKNPETGVLTVGNKTFIEDLEEDGKAVYGDYTVEEKGDGIYHIHDTGTSNPSSMYLIVKNNEALLIDGSNGTSPKQFQYIVKEIIGDRKLSMALTHMHGDHIGLLTKDAIDKDVKIYIPELDYTDAVKQATKGHEVQLLKDQDTITIGQSKARTQPTTLTAQYLKGHTEGSMVFIDKDAEIVYSGDAVGSGFVWQLFVDNALTLYEEGLNNLLDVTKDFDNLVILPGHVWQEQNNFVNGQPGVGKDPDRQYLQDMLKILDGIYEGKAEFTDYTHIATYFDDSVEVTMKDVKAAIDTRQSLVDQYIQNRKANEKPVVEENKEPQTEDKKEPTVKDTSKKSDVKTGDNTNITPYLILSGMAIILATGIILKKKFN